MAIDTTTSTQPQVTKETNGDATGTHGAFDASRLKITLKETLSPIPPPESLVFGEVKTDHMLLMSYDPTTGWSAPEIKPYAPLVLDPASSCFQYCPNVFEGMKAYIGPDGTPRLFRPEENMKRLVRSADRMALPAFDPDQLLILIRRLVLTDARWIPTELGYSLYLRPTIIGTRPALGVSASDSAMLYVIMCPTGPYFKNGLKPISLLGVGDSVRAWPGGTGSYKLGLNYAPGFVPQRVAAKLGYDQVLWIVGEEGKIMEAGAMNFFVVVTRDDGGVDLITPHLDGTILPGVTRSSCLALANAHTQGKTVLPGVLPTQRIVAHEKDVTMRQLVDWCREGKVLEAFAVGTAVVVAPIAKIGFEGHDLSMIREGESWKYGKALRERIVDIQEGRAQWEGWNVVC